MQVNVCCIRNKILELEDICRENQVNIICVSEHWLKDSQVDLFVPSNFIPAQVVCRTFRKNGGVGIYIRNSITFAVIDLSQFYLELDFECCGIKLTEDNVFILSIYRSPSGDINNFLENFELTVKRLHKNNQKLIIAGDFNIEMGKESKGNVVSVKFFNLLRSLNLFSCNNQSTRVNSCIDNIFVNFNKNLYDIILGDHCFADHIPLFFNLYNFKTSSTNQKQTGNTYVRLQNKENVELFIKSLEKEKWQMIDAFKLGKIDVEALFNGFFKTYIDIWHSCSPLIKLSNRTKPNQIKSNTINWYTPALKVKKK
jgi:hypothetical protein